METTVWPCGIIVQSDQDSVIFVDLCKDLGISKPCIKLKHYKLLFSATELFVL